MDFICCVGLSIWPQPVKKKRGAFLESQSFYCEPELTERGEPQSVPSISVPTVKSMILWCFLYLCVYLAWLELSEWPAEGVMPLCVSVCQDIFDQNLNWMNLIWVKKKRPFNVACLVSIALFFGLIFIISATSLVCFTFTWQLPAAFCNCDFSCPVCLSLVCVFFLFFFKHHVENTVWM